MTTTVDEARAALLNTPCVGPHAVDALVAAVRAEGLDVERLARAMHLARLAPDREEPFCDQPFTEMDLANHVRVAEGVMWAYRMLPKETTND